MTRKSKFLALTGLVLALAAGTTAVRAWSRGGPEAASPSPPGQASGACGVLIRKAPHINRTCSAQETPGATGKEGKLRLPGQQACRRLLLQGEEPRRRLRGRLRRHGR